MPEIKNHPPGAFCWAEVGTVDAPRTKEFYAKLFGWTYDDQPAGEFGTYTMIRSGGKDLGGLYELPPELMKMGLPPHWMSYIAVQSADDACRKVQEHGGKVQQGPMDVMDVGRMAICQDPTGATFSVWEPRAHQGTAVMGEVGTPCWFELSTRDVERAQKFYVDVFGWTMRVDADQVYREMTAPGASCPMGGMMEMKPEQGQAPPHWMIYMTVDDCDAHVKRAQELGGRVYMPAMEVPKVGRFAVLADPAGAAFAVIKLAFDPTAGSHEPKKQTTAAKPKAKAKTAAKPRKK
jgi:predicted enzyme related to lactoylglutathione lyase